MRILLDENSLNKMNRGNVQWSNHFSFKIKRQEKKTQKWNWGIVTLL